MRCVGDALISKCRYPAYFGDCLHQNFLTFAVEFGREDRHPGRVSAGFCERSNETLAQHIVGEGEDWYFRRCPLSGTYSSIAARQDHVHTGSDKLSRVFVKLVYRKAITMAVEDQVMAFDEPQLTQCVAQGDLVRRVDWSGE